MKLITLNTWGGRIKEPFIEFIKSNKDVDIFCFQEIYEKAENVMKTDYPDNMFDGHSDLIELLPNHQGYFRPSLLGVYGIAIFIKKDIPVLEEGEILIHAAKSGTVADGHHSRSMQWIKFKHVGVDFTVMNVHGLWNGMGKNDSPERIAQSNVIREFMDKVKTSKILCGDFNLNPDTESIKILEAGMKNLIKNYSITSTRTNIYFAKGEKSEKFADYVFISPGIHVKDFKVMPDEVSDHSALLLEI